MMLWIATAFVIFKQQDYRVTTLTANLSRDKQQTPNEWPLTSSRGLPFEVLVQTSMSISYYNIYSPKRLIWKCCLQNADLNS